MSRSGSDYEFITANRDQVEADTIAAYIEEFGKVPTPGSPDMLFCKWVTSLRVQDRVAINVAGNSNLPSRAEGEDLDALAELFYIQSRPAATYATVYVNFYISEAQTSAVIIPAGTRVTTDDQDIYFAVVEDTQIDAGFTMAQAECRCLTAGTAGNGYTARTITTCVDVFPYYASCYNAVVSSGGSDVPDDDEFYDLLLASMDAYGGGTRAAYKYYARTVSSEISDVRVQSLHEGVVTIYASMEDGTIATGAVREKIVDTCSDPKIKVLTDLIIAGIPTLVTYNVTFTYYISTDATESAATIAAEVEEAVEGYKKWQQAKMGRDIDPSELIYRLKAIPGIKRVVLTEPSYVSLHSGEEEITGTIVYVPQLAQIGTVTITNGGYEDE